jgi:DNA-binding NtrC family response regulator
MNFDKGYFLNEDTDPVLIVEDDVTAAEVIGGVLEANGIATVKTEMGRDAIGLFESGRDFTALLIDIALPDIDGISVLAAARRMLPSTPCYILTATDDPKVVVQAMKVGAIDYFTKPCDFDALLDELRRVIASQYAVLDDGGGLIIPAAYRKTKSVRQALLRAELAFHDNAPVLIHGPRFTGKSLLARIIHARSVPQRVKLIKLDLSAYNTDDAEFELFGDLGRKHDVIAEDGDCLLNTCGDSTLLIESLENLQPAAQVMLAQWLIHAEQSRRSVGRARIISTSSANLDEMARTGDFCPVLLALLSTHRVQLPGLSDLGDEFPQVATEMLERISARMCRRYPKFSDCAMQQLKNYNWPLNLLEMKNVMVSALAASTDDLITLEHLSRLPVKEQIKATSAPDLRGPQQSVDEVLKNSLVNALNASAGNRKLAAKILKVSLRTVYNMIDRYEIKIPSSRRRIPDSKP